MSKFTKPVKWFGGKRYLAARIVALMPRHLHYVEPFAGGAAVLLERDPNDKRLWVSECGQRGGVSEVLNDLDCELMNFWSVMRDPDLFHIFVRECQATPVSRLGWELAMNSRNDLFPVLRAWAFFVAARQSRAGMFQGFLSLSRSRTRRGLSGNASEWLGAVEGLAAVHARLQPVVLECMDSLALVRREDTPDTLFYCDPPYLRETRTTKDAYAHEMLEDDHRDLLAVLKECEGKVMLSGYPSALYRDLLECVGWQFVDFNVANHAAGGATKRRMTERLWLNFVPEARANE